MTTLSQRSVGASSSQSAVQAGGGSDDVPVEPAPPHLRELQPAQGRGHHGGRLLGHPVLPLGGAHRGHRAHGGRTVLRTVRACVARGNKNNEYKPLFVRVTAPHSRGHCISRGMVTI